MILQNVCRILPRAVLKFRPKEFALRRPLSISSLYRADYKEGWFHSGTKDELSGS